MSDEVEEAKVASEPEVEERKPKRRRRRPRSQSAANASSRSEEAASGGSDAKNAAAAFAEQGPELRYGCLFLTESRDDHDARQVPLEVQPL